MKTVLVTAVGGNIGQGVVRNIKSYNLPIRVIGVDAKCVYPVKHLCDEVHFIPYAKDENYISELLKICTLQKVDFIIPVTEAEIYVLSSEWVVPDIKVACSNFKTIDILLDKYKTYHFFKSNNIPFAESILPSNYRQEFSEKVVKRRKGYAWKDVFFNPVNTEEFDDSFVVQKLYKGVEITTGFYITKESQLLGNITLEKHSHGINQACNITQKYDDIIMPIIRSISEKLEIRGCADLQAIITDDGKIYPFEVNCRLSGSNSIRSQFGFEDVKYLLLENLYNIVPQKPQVLNGSSVRAFMDVIFLDIDVNSISKNSSYYIF